MIFVAANQHAVLSFALSAKGCLPPNMLWNTHKTESLAYSVWTFEARFDCCPCTGHDENVTNLSRHMRVIVNMRAQDNLRDATDSSAMS